MCFVSDIHNCHPLHLWQHVVLSRRLWHTHKYDYDHPFTSKVLHFIFMIHNPSIGRNIDVSSKTLYFILSNTETVKLLVSNLTLQTVLFWIISCSILKILGRIYLVRVSQKIFMYLEIQQKYASLGCLIGLPCFKH